MKVAFFGYAGSGKSALVNALGGRRPAGGDPRRPVEVPVRVGDERFARLAARVPAKRVVYPEATLVDGPGPPAGTPPERPLLERLAGADAICLVADGFSAAARPETALASLRLELVYHDLERLAALREGPRPGAALREQALARLEAEQPLHGLEAVAPGELHAALGGLGLVTLVPLFEVVNGPGAPAAPRAPVGRLSIDAAAGPGGERFWPAAVAAAGRLAFYTLGEKENRAWLLAAPATFLEAAARIHGDLARGFIRAEVVSAADFLAAGSWSACRAAGQVRLEGKNAPVADGDVLHIRSGTAHAGR